MENRNRVMTLTGIIKKGKFFNSYSYVNENGEEGEICFTHRAKVGEVWELTDKEWRLIGTAKTGAQ